MIVKYLFKGSGGEVLYFTIGTTVAVYTLLFALRLPIATFSLDSLKMESPFSIETPYFITQFVWLICMMLGYCIRKASFIYTKKVSLYVVFAASVLSFFAIRILNRDGNHSGAEYFSIVIYVSFAFSLFMIMKSEEQRCKRYWRTFPGKIISVFSVCSLEIYYVQFLWIEWLKQLLFPLNLILLLVAIALSAYAVHWIASKIFKKLI